MLIYQHKITHREKNGEEYFFSRRELEKGIIKGKIDAAKNDAVGKDFWRNNEHFADLFNAVLFGGEQIIKPENLEEMDTDVSGVIMADDYKLSLGRFRDVVKKNFDGIELVVLGLELQEHIHYGMPLRTMIYDSLGYLKEFEGVRKWNKQNGVKAVNADEFLSGIKKDDRFHPIINIILYYGEKEWDGPTSLQDMMVDMPERFSQLFADYHINLVQMLDSGKLLFHNNNVRMLFDVVSNIYRNNIDYIYSKYDGTRVDKDLLWMIGKITENKDMIELSEIKEGESVDMCDAWKKFYEKARQEGFKTGNEDGIRSATIDNIIFMIRYGIPKKDLLTKFTEEEYNEALSKMKTM